MHRNKPIDEQPQKRFLFEKELRRQKANRIALEAIERASGRSVQGETLSSCENPQNKPQGYVPIEVQWRMEELQGKIDRLKHRIEQLPPEIQETALPTLLRYVSELRSLEPTTK